MASCARIENLVQAYLDGDLSDSEQVIFERHITECPRCARSLKEAKACAAELFEILAAYRRARELVEPVMDHLPDMEPTDEELAGLNWRVKHPGRGWRRFWQVAAAMTVLIVAVVALVLNFNWPRAVVPADAVGIVTAVDRDAYCYTGSTSVPAEVGRNDFVLPGAQYETALGSALEIALANDTRLRLGPGSRIRIPGARRLRVEAGEVWLRVGRDGSIFRVATPSSDISVFGTVLAVGVDAAETVVTVGNGEVTVARGQRFRVLGAGQRLVVGALGELPEPIAALPTELIAWSEAVHQPQAAQALLEEQPRLSRPRLELAGRYSYVVPLPDGGGHWRVNAICLYWEPTGSESKHCGYQVYVSDGQLTPLFRARIPGTFFDDHERASCEIPVPGEPITGVNVLVVRLVPDLEEGTIETHTFDVKALAVSSR